MAERRVSVNGVGWVLRKKPFHSGRTCSI